MNRILKISLAILVLLVFVVASALSYLSFALPDVGDPPDINIEGTPAQIERGEYLANHVMACMDCHSQRDWSKFSGPLVPGTLGQGGEAFDQTLGFPGSYISKNITPYKLSEWSDGEIMRAITSGVSKDGHALFPIMPYNHYGTLDKEDLKDVIAYLRTLPSIQKENSASSSDIPMNFIINTIPQEAQFTQRPDRANPIKYGEYLVNAAACFDCHTKQEQGQFVGAHFAGGMEFPLTDGSVVRSSNITSHNPTGIGAWTEDFFVDRFKMYADSGYVPHDVAKGEFQTIMPWTMYADMKEDDLKAIYAYLQTVPAVENVVVKFVGK